MNPLTRAFTRASGRSRSTVEYHGTATASGGTVLFQNLPIGTAASDREVIIVCSGVAGIGSTATIGGVSAVRDAVLSGGAGLNYYVFSIWRARIAGGTTTTFQSNTNDVVLWVYTIKGCSYRDPVSSKTSDSINFGNMICSPGSVCIGAGFYTSGDATGKSITGLNTDYINSNVRGTTAFVVGSDNVDQFNRTITFPFVGGNNLFICASYS